MATIEGNKIRSYRGYVPLFNVTRIAEKCETPAAKDMLIFELMYPVPRLLDASVTVRRALSMQERFLMSNSYRAGSGETP